MSVTKVTFGDILTSAAIDDIDEALLPLMTIAGIESGDVAGVVFSGGEFETWPTTSKSERIKMLAHWLAVEHRYEEPCAHAWHFNADNIETCRHCGVERGENR